MLPETPRQRPRAPSILVWLLCGLRALGEGWGPRKGHSHCWKKCHPHRSRNKGPLQSRGASGLPSQQPAGSAEGCGQAGRWQEWTCLEPGHWLLYLQVPSQGGGWHSPSSSAVLLG